MTLREILKEVFNPESDYWELVSVLNDRLFIELFRFIGLRI